MEMRSKKQKYTAIVIICLMIIGFICFIIIDGIKTRKETKYSETGFSMGTVLNITVYGPSGNKNLEEIEELLNSLETNDISWRKEQSEVYKLNNDYTPGNPYEISRELAEYLNTVKELNIKSGGLLDATIRPLAKLWGIEDGLQTVPSYNDIQNELKNVDMSKIGITDDNGKYYVVINQDNMSIDLGSVGKGIGCDRVYDYLKQSDVTGACISIGGSIVVYGNKPDNEDFKIGIRNPRGETGEVVGIVELSAEDKNAIFMSTSGDYEKYFEVNGKRYHHIINPLTGYPADEGIISATVICENGLLSDGLSTLAVLLGKDKALELISSYGAEAILIDSDKNIYITDGISNNFLLKNSEYRVAK